jgi:lipopolysaccharide transport system ATP-binding protein
MLATGWPARFEFEVEGCRAGATCSFTIYDQFGQAVTHFNSAQSAGCDVTEASSPPVFVCEIEEFPLMAGRYRINAAILYNGELQDHLEGAAIFDVAEGLVRGRPVPRSTGYGSIALPHRWISPSRAPDGMPAPRRGSSPA